MIKYFPETDLSNYCDIMQKNGQVTFLLEKYRNNNNKK